MIPGQAQQFFEAAAAQAGGEAGYQIDRDLRFNSADSAYLNRTPSSAGNRRTWTWAGWVKRSELGGTGSVIFSAYNGVINQDLYITFINASTSSGPTDGIALYSPSAGANIAVASDAVFRDVSAWYHIVCSVDTTQSTAADRVKIYVNGTEVTYNVTTYPSLNQELQINSTQPHAIGSRPSGVGSAFFNGYLADVYLIDGQALDSTDFGEYDDNNVWQPKAYTFTTNPNNGTTWSNNTTGTAAGVRPFTAAFDGSLSTWFQSDSGLATINFSGLPAITSLEIYAGITTTSDNQFLYVNGVDKSSLFGTSAAWVTVPGITTLTSIASNSRSGIGVGFIHAIKVNGYVLLDGADDNSFHLPFSDNSSNAALGYDAAVEAPTLNPRGGMDVVTYTGNGSTQSISSLAFQPDFVWIKNRSANGSHDLYDSVRGADLVLNSDTTAAEYSGNGRLTSFNSDGFNLGSQPAVNINGGPFVAWCWRAGGTAVSNTDGTITSQVSASTDYGFSIVTYQSNGIRGASIGHGLNTAPSWVVVKNRDNAFDWMVGHDGLGGWSNFIRLNTSGTKGSASSIFADTAPTSSVFYVGEDNTVNAGSSVQNYVAYCWSEVSGFSKFGSFTHPSTTSLNLGFKPKFFLIKETDGTTPWYLFDAERDSFDNPLFPNTVGAEGSGFAFTANGSGISWVSGSLNAGTYIYAAFADRPGNNWDVNNLIASDGTIAAASGALPILNTTGDYGKGVGTGTRTDSDSSSIVLALPMNGINNGTTFTDYHATIKGSGTAKTITVNGNTKTSTDQNIFYGSSGAFDGTDDNLKLPTSADFQFGSGDFTIETWFRPNNTNRMAIYHGSSGTDHTVGIDYSYITQTIGIWASSTGTSWDLADGDSSGNRGSIVVPTNAWTHIAFVRNGDFLQLYVGGALDKQFSITGSIVDASSFQPIIGEWWNNVYDLNGYLADFRIYKGVGKYTSSFNPPNLEDAPETDSLIDTPTNYEASSGNNGGNYATLNPLQKSSGSTLTNGNLDISMSSSQGTTFATMAFSASGKYYFECTANASQCDVGIAKAGASLSEYLGNNTSGYGYYIDGNVYHNNSSAGSGASYGSGDIIGVAFDADAGTCKWYKNNVLQVTISSLSGEWFPAFGAGSAAGIFNFGQRPFAYTPPTGYKSLCTTNLPDPTIADGSTAMDAVIYSSTGSAQTISGLNISPDLVWIKNRSATVAHRLYDIIRGVNKPLTPNDSSEEANETGLSAFNSDGFSVSGSRQEVVGTSGNSLVGWAWDAGSSTVSNTDGSITSTVRANANAGFSIVKYSGNSGGGSWGHSLNTPPEFIIFKRYTAGQNWFVWLRESDGTYLEFEGLNNDRAAYSSRNNVSATNSVVTLTTAAEFNSDTNSNYIAYCFSPVSQFSAFGEYTGNGSSSDGPFVYTGFRPKWLLLRCSSILQLWLVLDSARDEYNIMSKAIQAHVSDAEIDNATNYGVDFTSNGFKIRSSTDRTNGSGQTYIYAAFAEHPFKTARAR